MAQSEQQPAAPLAVGHSTFLPNNDAPKPRGGFQLGFLFGVLAGVIATLFLVPKTGEETREQVKEIAIVLRARAIGMMTGERPYAPTQDEAGPMPV
ncbi:MAG: YtxH domain-containing protein [Thermomicrobia bacterium]|nr:YtxH domain-containing protein [Thermomicrobia bacterium]MCA1723866.1 YtxH domain-containing protein [Thermomicrobia bacterium]